jgi:predicted transglutaminase-like cysteine proteinase
MKTKKTKRFTRTLKMSGIGYYIEDTKTGEVSNEHFRTIKELNDFIENVLNTKSDIELYHRERYFQTPSDIDRNETLEDYFKRKN